MTKWGARHAEIGKLTLAILIAGGNLHGTSKKPQSAVLEVVRAIPHTGYSEGLDFHDGFLWHALPKELLKIDPQDGTVLARYTPATSYSESLAWVGSELWNVSFSDNGLYRGKLSQGKIAFRRIADVPEIHAWGITHTGSELVVTGNFSKRLYFLDPKSGKQLRSIEVAIGDLEDLAWDGKGIWTSSFTQHRGSIFRVDPLTGASTKPLPLPDAEACPVVDGIAFDGKQLWITGKHCPSIYSVRLPALN